ncbi:MAG TPA: class I tRNA ligase family protein, partial [Acidimicrobiales bacterium]|nr:class I tRNA ligase family protein [Acidimicrobiales bacterium]
NHLIGKEIIRFHCVWWPAMCMAAGLEPVHHVQVNGWLLVGGEKLGKTMAAEGGVKLTDIEPIGLTEEFGVDALRYYLLRETALGNDGEFSLEGIAARYNTDLANNLGNLVARVAAVVASKCGGVGPLPHPDSVLKGAAMSAVEKTAAAWEQFAPQRALEVTFDLVGATNAYLEAHAPWKMEKGSEVDAVMGDALEAIRLVAILISPAMPSVARDIWGRIGLVDAPDAVPLAQAATWGQYPGGAVEKGEPLFPRIKVDA